MWKARSGASRTREMFWKGRRGGCVVMSRGETGEKTGLSKERKKKENERKEEEEGSEG